MAESVSFEVYVIEKLAMIEQQLDMLLRIVGENGVKRNER